MNSKQPWSQSKSLAFLFTIVGVIILLLGNKILDERASKQDVSLEMEYNEPKREFHYIPKGPDPTQKKSSTDTKDIMIMDEDEFKDYMEDYIGDEYGLTPKEYGRENR